MTASDDDRPAPRSDGRSLADQALDLFVFAPAGVVITAVEDLPEMAAKGRARFEQQLRNARIVGRFAFDMGRRQLSHQFEQMTGGGGAPRPAPGASGAATRPAPSAPATSAPPEKGTRATPHARPGRPPEAGEPRSATTPSTARDPAVDRAIPDYDSLSASQVVRRLDSLAPHELRAIERHELANRGRRTILNRAHQLLGETEPPSAAPTS